MENTNTLPNIVETQQFLPMFGYFKGVINPKTQFFKKLLMAEQEFDAMRANTKAYNYKYADLTQVMAIINPSLHKHGLMYRQPVFGNTMQTIIIDVETLEHILIFETHIRDEEGNGKMIAIQRWGSAITYTRRYSLVTAFNLSTEEDTDGVPPQSNKQAAADYNNKKQSAPQQEVIAPPPPPTPPQALKETPLEELATIPEIDALYDLWILRFDAASKVLKSDQVAWAVNGFKTKKMAKSGYTKLLEILKGL